MSKMHLSVNIKRVRKNTWMSYMTSSTTDGLNLNVIKSVITVKKKQKNKLVHISIFFVKCEHNTATKYHYLDFIVPLGKFLFTAPSPLSVHHQQGITKNTIRTKAHIWRAMKGGQAWLQSFNFYCSKSATLFIQKVVILSEPDFPYLSEIRLVFSLWHVAFASARVALPLKSSRPGMNRHLLNINRSPKFKMA